MNTGELSEQCFLQLVPKRIHLDPLGENSTGSCSLNLRMAESTFTIFHTHYVGYGISCSTEYRFVAKGPFLQLIDDPYGTHGGVIHYPWGTRGTS